MVISSGFTLVSKKSLKKFKTTKGQTTCCENLVKFSQTIKKNWGCFVVDLKMLWGFGSKESLYLNFYIFIFCALNNKEVLISIEFY